jgi:hypothetical protein
MLKVISNLSREEKIMKTQTAIPVFYTGTSTVNNEKEIWKAVPGFEGIYEASNMGRIKSLNYRNTGKEQVLKPMHRNCDKYLRICLCRKGKRTYEYLHRLIALVFIPNPHSLPEVNHIDTNPRNCKVSNLEWCTHEQNTNHWKTRLNRSKKVYCYNSSGDLEYTYSSVLSCASALRGSTSHIAHCAKAEKKYKGYTLSYTRL